MRFLSLGNWLKPLQGQVALGGRRQRRCDRSRWGQFLPRLEPLEDRTVPSTLFIDDTANASATTWLITATKITETIQGSPFAPPTFDTTAFTGAVINAGSGGNVFNVQSTAAAIPLTVNSQAADSVNLGNAADGVQDIRGDVTLNNPSQLTALSIDDSADTVGRTVSVASAGITGLAPANILFPHNPGRSITILGGSGGNEFDVLNTASGTTTTLVTQRAENTATVGQNGSMQGILGNLILDPNGPNWSAVRMDDSADAASRTVTITQSSITGLAPSAISYAGVVNLTVEGDGGSQFDVQGTAAGTTTTLVTQQAENTATVGQNGSVQGILGDLVLDPTGPSWRSVGLDDSTDAVSRTVTITQNSITGLAPAAISYAGVKNLTVEGGGGGAQFNVQGTAVGTTTTLVTQQAQNTATVGRNGSVQCILGDLVLDPTGPNWSAVRIDDSADAASRTITITQNSITGLAPANITYAGVTNLSVNAGAGGSQFDVQGTAAGTTTTLVTQQADNTATVGQKGSVQGILGNLILDPIGPQWSAVSLDDSTDAVSRTVTITQNSITGLAPGAISYAGVANLTLDGGSGGTHFAVQGTAAGTTTTLVTQQAENTATVGQNGSVQGILGNLILDPTGPQWRAVSLDDSADASTRTVTITQNLIAGLAPAAITYAGVVMMKINGGSGGDTFSVQSLPPAATAVSLNGGGGSNTLDYSAFCGDIVVDLPLGTATGLSGGISNIQNVTGSQGNDLIVGDAHDNVLVGGTGRNVIIGGAGSDQIIGGDGDNILIGGTTVWDANAAALQAIMQEWTDAGLGFDQRVNALRKGIVVNDHTYALDRSTVTADGSRDSLIGGGGQNWFFADHDDTINNGAGPRQGDRLTRV